MMQEQNTPDLDSAGEEDPRKQLWIRAGVAIGLISVLLGGLAVFDRLSRPPVPEEVVAPTRPIAPAQVASEAGRDAPPDVLKSGVPGTDAAPGSDVPPLPAEGSVPPLPGPVKDEGAVRGERGGRIAEGSRPSVRAPAPDHAAAVPPACCTCARCGHGASGDCTAAACAAGCQGTCGTGFAGRSCCAGISCVCRWASQLRLAGGGFCDAGTGRGLAGALVGRGDPVPPGNPGRCGPVCRSRRCAGRPGPASRQVFFGWRVDSLPALNSVCGRTEPPSEGGLPKGVFYSVTMASAWPVRQWSARTGFALSVGRLAQTAAASPSPRAIS